MSFIHTISLIPLDKILISSPLSILLCVLALTALVLSLYFFYKIIFMKKSNLEKSINYILLICFFMIFFVLVDQFQNWSNFYSSILSGKTTYIYDPNMPTILPRQFMISLIVFIIKIFFQSALISFFMIVWFLLRAFNRVKIEQSM
jgi:hypothetical protein